MSSFVILVSWTVAYPAWRTTEAPRCVGFPSSKTSRAGALGDSCGNAHVQVHSQAEEDEEMQDEVVVVMVVEVEEKV